MQVGDELHIFVTFPPRKILDSDCIGGYLGPAIDLGAFGDEKVSSPDFEPRTYGPVRSLLAIPTELAPAFISMKIRLMKCTVYKEISFYLQITLSLSFSVLFFVLDNRRRTSFHGCPQSL